MSENIASRSWTCSLFSKSRGQGNLIKSCSELLTDLTGISQKWWIGWRRFAFISPDISFHLGSGAWNSTVIPSTEKANSELKLCMQKYRNVHRHTLNFSFAYQYFCLLSHITSTSHAPVNRHQLWNSVLTDASLCVGSAMGIVCVHHLYIWSLVFVLDHVFKRFICSDIHTYKALVTTEALIRLISCTVL